MGGFSRVEIVFKKEIPLAFSSKTAMEQSIDKDLNIYEFYQADELVTFDLASDKMQNLNNQMKLVINYIVNNNIEVVTLNCSGYASSHYGSFNYDGDGELSDYHLD